MPATETRNTLARQWQLLRLLPSRGSGLSATELAERLAQHGFEVTKRQVERDLHALADLQIIVCNSKSKPYGWHWPRGGVADLPGLELADALSVYVIEETLRPLLPHTVLGALERRFAQARTGLRALQRHNDAARWVDKVRSVPPALPLQPPNVLEATLNEIQTALLKDEQIVAKYQSAEDKSAKQVRLHPLGLVQRGPVTYLVATAFDYEQPRLYALHRFKAARRTYEAAHRPAGFDLDAFIEHGGLQFGATGDIRLKLRVSPELGTILQETALARDQTIQRDSGAITVTATVPDSGQLVWWLLSQGASVEVLEPPGLRAKVEKRLLQALQNYRCAPATHSDARVHSISAPNPRVPTP